MKLHDHTDRLDDLIDQIDQTNVKKQRKGVLLFFGIFAVIAFTTYLSFAQGNKQHSNNIPKKSNSNNKVKAQVISSSVALKNISDSSGETILDDDESSKTPAVFSGNAKGITQYLKDQIIYPDDAFDNKVEGKVLVQVTINEAGIVEDPKIVKGLGYGCDEEVIRVVTEMPKWQPAMVNQNPVKKSYILTVTFSLS